MENLKKIARGTILIFLGTLLGSGFSYLFRMFLTRRISSAEYGLFASVLAFITLFEIFRNLGLNSSLIKHVSEERALNRVEEGKKITIITILLELILAIIIVILLKSFSNYLVINYFKQKEALIILNWGLIYFVIETISTGLQHFFLAIQKPNLFAIKKPLFNILTFVFIFFIPFNDARLPIMSVVLGLICSTIVLSILFSKSFGSFITIEKKDFKRLIPKLLRFGLPITIASLGNIIIAQFDTIMLTSLTTLREVGIYNIILPLALTLGFIGQSVEKVLFPLTSELNSKKDLKKIKKSLSISCRFAISISMLISLPLILFPEFIIKLLFGAEYVLGKNALMILIPGIIFSIIGGIILIVILGLGRSKVSSSIIISSAVINVILNILLIPKFGISGAALATSISYFSNYVLSSLMLKKISNISFPIKKLFNLLVIWVFAIICGKIGIIISENYGIILKVLLPMSLSLISYCSMLFLFKIIRIDEIKRIF